MATTSYEADEKVEAVEEGDDITDLTLPEIDNDIDSLLNNKRPRKNSVFIAYHKNDQAFARKIQSVYNVSDRKVYYDTVDAAISPEWLDQIHKAIEAYDVFLFVLSPDSNESSSCAFQLDHAVKNGKRIIVICVKPVDYKKVLKKLVPISWITLDNSLNEKELRETVQLAVSSTDVDQTHVQLHTIFLRCAIEWERHDFEKSLLLSGNHLLRAQHWLSAAALGRTPQPTTLHLSFITASASLDQSMDKRKVIAFFFAVIVAIGIIWPSWGVFFFSLVFSHFFVYFSSS